MRTADRSRPSPSVIRSLLEQREDHHVAECSRPGRPRRQLVGVGCASTPRRDPCPGACLGGGGATPKYICFLEPRLPPLCNPATNLFRAHNSIVVQSAPGS